MKPNQSTPPDKTAGAAPKPGTSPLNLSPEQAEREAAKLRELNADLENRKKVDDTSARTTPFGRNE